MKIIFNLEYQTTFGEELAVNILQFFVKVNFKLIRKFNKSNYSVSKHSMPDISSVDNMHTSGTPTLYLTDIKTLHQVS